jgi:hypothetical protein
MQNTKKQPHAKCIRFRFVCSLPALDPAADGLQGWVVIKPVTCPDIGGSEIGYNVGVGDSSQVLVKCSGSALQSCSMLCCWPLAAQSIGAGHGPSPGCSGAQVYLVGLKSACATVEYHSRGVLELGDEI